jgi:hypothetical protein
VKRLRELEVTNAKLTRRYADLALENAAIKDVLHENCRAAREAVDRPGARCGASAAGAAGVSRGEAVSSGVLPASSVAGPA